MTDPLISESILSTRYLEPAVYVVLAWLLREFYVAGKDKTKEQDNATKENTTAITLLREELIKFEAKLDLMSEFLTPLMRLPQDVTALHAKVRNLLKEKEQ